VRGAENNMENTNKSKFELTVELVKALAWPSVVVILLFAFWAPLENTINILPQLIDRSDTITIGSVAIKVGRKLSGHITPEVKKALKNISDNGIERLLDFEEDQQKEYGKDHKPSAPTYELIKLKLLISEKKSNTNDDEFYVYMSPTGIETRKALLLVIAEFVYQLKHGNIKESDCSEQQKSAEVGKLCPS